jgi:hypothetical protein
VLVVFASTHDDMAQTIVRAWALSGAVLCVPADLSRPGWTHRVGAPEAARAVLGGRVMPAAEITGVLTRLWHVPSAELTHIARSDRPYVAAEMTAFLTAFLMDLPGVVLNKPTASALSGQGWRREQWVRAAARAGIPVFPAQRIARVDEPGATAPTIAAEVTVVGEQVFGTADPDLTHWALQLASLANVGLLGIRFARHGHGFAFTDVNPWPILTFPGVLDAVRQYLIERS